MPKACSWISLEYLGFPAGLQRLKCTWSLLCGESGVLSSHPDAEAQSVLERILKDPPLVLALFLRNLP